MFFLFYFSEIFPIKHHFFHITGYDCNKSYRPKSEVTIDISTANGLFAKSRNATKRTISGKAIALCQKWNEHFLQTVIQINISLKLFISI